MRDAGVPRFLEFQVEEKRQHSEARRRKADPKQAASLGPRRRKPCAFNAQHFYVVEAEQPT
jgi:hypothetical protein